MSKREMFINYVPGEESRIAIVEDGKLEELYQERASSESHVGNIYKGRVTNVEPSIQAAFIDFGLERNGFLHITDLHPKFFPGDAKEETEQVGLKTPRRDRPPIQRCLRRGQEILVQVLKEGIGTKGPTLTSYLSTPGRFLVMMPDMERMGVSRKVEDDDARREMKKILDELKPPKGYGFIIRTAGIGQSKTELKRDLAYLTRLWKSIETRRKATPKVGELYAESDLVIRTLRDIYTPDITRVIIDNETAARKAYDYLAVASPRSRPNVIDYKDPVPLFDRFDIEAQIQTINARTVPLPSGGYLVIDSTEALVAIDVNSGKSRDHADAEMMAYHINEEAVDEICRQLRLRDLGGVIVNDLIDMHSAKHRRDIETRFRDNLKKDRAKTKTLAISQFGILEMTRQRMRPSLNKSVYSDCAVCKGQGQVKNSESVVLDVMRRLALMLQIPTAERVELTVSGEVAFQLLNRKRGQLVDLETRHGKSVMVRVYEGGGVDYVTIAAFDSRGSAIEAPTKTSMPEPLMEIITGESFDEEEETENSENADEQENQSSEQDLPQSRSARDKELPTEFDRESPPEPIKRAAAGNETRGASDESNPDEEPDQDAGGKRGRRHRRGRRGRGGRKDGGNPNAPTPAFSAANSDARTSPPGHSASPIASHEETPAVDDENQYDEFSPVPHDESNHVLESRDANVDPDSLGNVITDSDHDIDDNFGNIIPPGSIPGNAPLSGGVSEISPVPGMTSSSRPPHANPAGIGPANQAGFGGGEGGEGGGGRRRRRRGGRRRRGRGGSGGMGGQVGQTGQPNQGGPVGGQSGIGHGQHHPHQTTGHTGAQSRPPVPNRPAPPPPASAPANVTPPPSRPAPRPSPLNPRVVPVRSNASHTSRLYPQVRPASKARLGPTNRPASTNRPAAPPAGIEQRHVAPNQGSTPSPAVVSRGYHRTPGSPGAPGNPAAKPQSPTLFNDSDSGN